MGKKNGGKHIGAKASSGATKPASRESLQRRSKYIAHSIEFLDWVNGLGFERTWLGKLAQRFDRSFHLRRFSILFFFSIALSFLMFIDFDFSLSYRAGDRAVRDIRSPINFEIVDEISTEEKRRAAEDAVPLVFDYDRGVFDEAANRLYAGFRSMRNEIRQVRWNSDEFARDVQIRDFFKNKLVFEAAVARPVSDRHFEWLVAQRFSPHIEGVLTDLLESWTSLKIVEGLERILPTNARTVMLRELSRSGSGREMVVPVRELRDLLREEDFSAERTAIVRTLSLADQRSLINLARSVLIPNVTLNKAEVETRKQKARQDVLPVVIAIKKNQLILSQGSVIQPIHAVLLSEIENQRSNRNRNLTVLVSAILFVTLLLVYFSYLRRFTQNRIRVGPKTSPLWARSLSLSC